MVPQRRQRQSSEVHHPRQLDDRALRIRLDRKAPALARAFTLSALGGWVSSPAQTPVKSVAFAILSITARPTPAFPLALHQEHGWQRLHRDERPMRDAANAYPVVGPVVINEIMSNPFGLDRDLSSSET